MASSSSSSSSTRTAVPFRFDGSSPVPPSWAREWAAASLGCALADTAFNPLEVLKVRRQVSMSSMSTSSTAPGSILTAPGTAPSSSLGLARAAIADRGFVQGLLAPGLPATWIRAFSYTGFRIGLYPAVRDAIVDSGAFESTRSSSDTSLSTRGGDGIAARIAAGAATGAVGSALFNPVDVVRIRMQGPAPYRSTLGAFGSIAREEGIVKGLWRGTGVCMARAALLSGSQLATYDTAKRALKEGPWGMEEGPALHFAASFLSGVVAQTVTQPADTLKTLVMAEGGRPGMGRGGAATSAAVLGRLLATSGPLGLYRGYWPAAARQGPVMVIQMPIVEQFRKLLGLEYF